MTSFMQSFSLQRGFAVTVTKQQCVAEMLVLGLYPPCAKVCVTESVFLKNIFLIKLNVVCDIDPV